MPTTDVPECSACDLRGGRRARRSRSGCASSVLDGEITGSRVSIRRIDLAKGEVLVHSRHEPYANRTRALNARLVMKGHAVTCGCGLMDRVHARTTLARDWAANPGARTACVRTA